MAFLEFEFDSKTLKRMAKFSAIIPYEQFEPPYPTLYLLHGLGGNSSRWLHYTNVRYLAESQGVAVILPSGENSFYLDIPVEDGCLGDFGAYVGDELVQVSRELLPLSRERQDTWISGMSMGGYGAYRNGLKYCDNFGKAAIFAGAVHFYEYSRDWVRTKGNTRGELKNFEDLDVTEKTDRNPRYLIGQIQNRNQKDAINHFPEFYIACGTEDPLLGANEALAKALGDAGAAVTFRPGAGGHTFAFCNDNLPSVFSWLNPQTKARA
ncbi:MAG: hypothetical protein IJM83_00850 [Firmicutes bacterium]|nr:hypothetical protein [Bacillota bacterium]